MYKIIGSDQKTYGPVPAEQLRRWLTEGRIVPTTLVQDESSSEWKPLSSFPEFALPPEPATPPTIVAPKPQLPPQETNSMATTGFVFGIVSLIPCCCCFNFIFALLGLTFSIIALNRADQFPTGNGRNMAIAGLVCSVLGLGGSVLFTWLFGLLQHNPAINYNWQHRW